jgi:hypothetical protein
MVGAKVEESNRWGWNPLRDHVAKSTARPEFSLIALVCAGYEKTIAKDSWRSPAQTHRDYLNQLVTWGYTPSEVEQIIIDSGKPAEDEPKRHKKPLAGRNPHRPARPRPLTTAGPGTSQKSGGPPPRANHSSHSPAADRRSTHPPHRTNRMPRHQGQRRPPGSCRHHRQHSARLNP